MVLRARLRVLGGRRSGFGRHSAMRRLIVMHLLVADTGATVPLPFSTLITGSLRYKAERGQALHLSPRSASHKCPRARARISRPRLAYFRGVSGPGNVYRKPQSYIIIRPLRCVPWCTGPGDVRICVSFLCARISTSCVCAGFENTHWWQTLRTRGL